MNNINITNEQIEDFKRDGVICIPNVVAPDILQKLIAELDRFIKNEIIDKPSTEKYITKTGNEINSIHFLSEIAGYQFNDFFAQTAIQSLATQLLGSNAHFQLSESFLKPAEIGKKVFPHQDNEYFCLKENRGLNVITALDKATVENGAVYYYLGSHKLGPLKHKSLALKSYTVEDLNLDKFKLKHFELNAGDCLFHDIHTVHGSEENKSKYKRRTITRLYAPREFAIEKNRLNLKIKSAFAELFADKK